jgi:RNA polymerase sigma-70 factor (ECF subfamily)
VTGCSDWAAIAQLYAVLETLIRSPVVTINRAIALAEVQGAAAGLSLLDKIAHEARLATYQPYWAARAELLARVGNLAEARAAYDQAMGLEVDPTVRSFLQQRLERLG